MTYYLPQIKTALLFFPFIALLITLPYMIIQYHKYGSVLIYKTIVFYSFMLYLLCCYFLVIMPLPSFAAVENSAAIQPQLIPFTFISDFIRDSQFNINDFSTYLPAFRSFPFLTIFFNVMLFMPFGIYLRYYFKLKWHQVLLISFLLSLFFELTQLTGLYGIYPKAYRIFDVDDLITNTAGGMLGYFITPLFSFFLPERKTVDNWAYQKGVNVSFTRRFIAWLIDLTILFSLMIGLNLSGFSKVLPLGLPIILIDYLISVLLLFILIPLLRKGQTIGKWIVKIRLADLNKQVLKPWLMITRFSLIYLIIFPAPLWSIWCLTLMQDNRLIINLIFIALFFGFLGIAIIFPIHTFLMLFHKEKYLLYDRFLHIEHVSTIDYRPKENDSAK
ncbi:MAG: VanZ family protein [Erysipelotrichaceae bacterium]|nr:VanZ family protein [Erysipelotrichaceae bacterium]